MKIQKMDKSLDEYFALKDYRDDHFKRHVTKNGKPKYETLKEYPDALAFKLSEIPRKALYEERADKAARMPLSDPDIRGYIDINGRRQKYNVKTLEFVSYDVNSAKEPIILTYFPMKPEGWEKNKKSPKHEYKEKLTPEKDCK